MADTLKFELVSPERLLRSVTAVMVVVPGTEGDFAVLAQHAPFMTTIRPGVIELYTEEGGQPEKLFISGGFADTDGERLTILADEALALADANPAEIARRLKEARERQAAAGDGETNPEVAALEALEAALGA